MNLHQLFGALVVECCLHGFFDETGDAATSACSEGRVSTTPSHRLSGCGFEEEHLIIESVGVVASSRKQEELGRGLRSLIGPMQSEEGCVDCRVFQDATNPNAFQLEASWMTEEDLARHVRSEVYKKLLFLMEIGSEPPTIEFHDVSQTRGMDFIQSIREA
jgi:quinol monooxygenase YgiN